MIWRKCFVGDVIVNGIAKQIMAGLLNAVSSGIDRFSVPFGARLEFIPWFVGLISPHDWLRRPAIIKAFAPNYCDDFYQSVPRCIPHIRLGAWATFNGDMTNASASCLRSGDFKHSALSQFIASAPNPVDVYLNAEIMKTILSAWKLRNQSIWQPEVDWSRSRNPWQLSHKVAIATNVPT